MVLENHRCQKCGGDEVEPYEEHGGHHLGCVQCGAVHDELLPIYRVKQLHTVVMILTNLVRSVHLKQQLSLIDPNPPLNFWRVIYGNLMDVSVLEWCKLFGSDHELNQPTHWKNVFLDHQDFRDGLFQHLQIDQEKWDAYWTRMKTYRDGQVAHYDFSAEKKIPYFPVLDLALESSYFYYGRVVSALQQFGIVEYPHDLRKSCEEFSVSVNEIGKKALAATAGMRAEG